MNGFFLENIQKVSLSGKDLNCFLQELDRIQSAKLYHCLSRLKNRHSDCARAPATAGREHFSGIKLIDPWNLVHLDPIFIELDDGKFLQESPFYLMVKKGCCRLRFPLKPIQWYISISSMDIDELAVISQYRVKKNMECSKLDLPVMGCSFPYGWFNPFYPLAI